VSGETGGDADRELLDEVHPAEERPTSSEDYEDEDRYGDEDEEEDEGEKDDYDEDSDDDDEQKKVTDRAGVRFPFSAFEIRVFFCMPELTHTQQPCGVWFWALDFINQLI